MWERGSSRIVGSTITRLVFGLALAVATYGCAGITSRMVPAGGADGLIYYLPKRDVLATVTVTKEGAVVSTSLAVTETAAFPDLEMPLVATVPRNPIGTTDSTIGINAVGLLQSDSSAKTTSQLSTVLQSVASLAGTVARPAGPAPPQQDCTAAGTYTKVFAITEKGSFAESDTRFCGYDFKLSPLATVSTPPGKSETTSPGQSETPPGKSETTSPGQSETPPGKSETQPSADRVPGLFYRQLIPYKVVVTPVPRPAPPAATPNQNPANPPPAAPPTREFIILSPTGSPTYFLRLARAAFGSNTGAFTFDSGVPTKYGQKIDSELVGLLALPAQVLSAYFKAIGDAFVNRTTPLTAEASYLAAQNSLEIARQQREACIAALGTNDLAVIKAACAQ